jgi:hypothetical protein
VYLLPLLLLCGLHCVLSVFAYISYPVLSLSLSYACDQIQATGPLEEETSSKSKKIKSKLTKAKSAQLLVRVHRVDVGQDELFEVHWSTRLVLNRVATYVVSAEMCVDNLRFAAHQSERHRYTLQQLLKCYLPKCSAPYQAWMRFVSAV